MFAAAITLAHVSISAARQVLNSSGDMDLGSLPSALSCSTTAGSMRIPVSSACNRPSTWTGRPAGATSPCQPVTAYPGKPASEIVGASGRLKNRFPARDGHRA